jgi:cytochrome P450
MVQDKHAEFFEQLDWYAKEDCERLPQELAWARDECPIVHSGYGGGMHVVTTYEHVRTVAEHPELFSSAQPGVLETPAALPPLDLDPPLHRDFRGVLNRYFSRSFLLKFRPSIEELADKLIDSFIDDGSVEFVKGFAIPFTSGSLTRAVLDDPDLARMERAIAAVNQVGEGDSTAHLKIAEIAGEILREREADPAGRDDVLSALAVGTVEDGRKLTQNERLGAITVLLLGGLDTTRGAISHIARFLAQDPPMEHRLRNPEWIKRDLDEFLRFTSPVSVMGRVVRQDTDVLGCPMRSGDRIAIHYQSGNRDAAKFDNPDSLVFDRDKNPHIAFGVGIHRCIGQHFARLQIEVAFERLLARLTDFGVVDGTKIVETSGITPLAPAEMHLRFQRRLQASGGPR